MGIKKSVCLFFILLMASCSNDGIMEKMEQIKTFGNGNPEMALTMLDSLELDVRDKGEYVRNKYDLLRIRLNDKANHMPSSDMMIKKLVAYFEEKGSVPEKQEAYYYAGSIYRDLQDTPRAPEGPASIIKHIRILCLVGNTGSRCPSRRSTNTAARIFRNTQGNR